MPIRAQEDDGCLKSGCHDQLMALQTVHAPVAEDCTNCHEGRGAEHPQKQGDEFELVAEVPELCAICHEIPGKEMVVHAPVQAGKCLTCHSPHSAENASLLVTEITGELCATCHDLELIEGNTIHNPVANGDCGECHNAHGAGNPKLLKDLEPNLCVQCHQKRAEDLKREKLHYPLRYCTTCHKPHQSAHSGLLVANLGELCYSCHDAPSENVEIHQPVAEGECLSCHSAHSSEQNDMLLAETVGELCKNCHDVGSENAFSVHTPAGKNKCQSCHEPHASEKSTLLKDEIPALCFECHEQQQLELKMKNVHTPAEDCLSCHSPHNSQYPRLLQETIPALCFNCHDDFRTGENVNVVHGVLQVERSCISCHLPHGSVNEMLLKQNQPDLCLTCHSRDLLKDDRKIKNIGSRLSEDNNIHPVIESDGCLICHQPHVSSYSSLLVDRFPSGMYGSDGEATYSLCFDCHDSRLLMVETSVLVTNFRDGIKNLHYLHVNRVKSRSCILCHDVHGAEGEHLLPETIPFGKWQMPLNYQATKDGGSCKPGCHGERSYHRTNK